MDFGLTTMMDPGLPVAPDPISTKNWYIQVREYWYLHLLCELRLGFRFQRMITVSTNEQRKLMR